MASATETTGDMVERGPSPPTKATPLAALALGALGVVFGDIGTSPLYTMKTVLGDVGAKVDAATTLGVLSLLVWTLVIVTTVKYVLVAMRIDNDGEGGILALMSLIGIKRGHRPAIVVLGLFGAALIYGDGAITPAISVLSALEGLHIIAPSFDPWVLPGTIAILIILFAIQPFGTSVIGRLFGPVMSIWFLAITLLGVWGILQNLSVLRALDPLYGLSFLVHGGFKAFSLLGSVFLCVTGAEALYADMGHFGRRPIWLSWFGLVFPALIINYAGQAAIVLNGAPTTDNIFYRLCPQPFLIALIVLATVATIIASQSIITGAFSMTRQAIQLGWLPRLIIRQTSAEGYGQIYVGAVNWLLMLATVGLALLFRKSDNLASAYGIAVSATMLMTSALLFIAMREVWGWSIAAAGGLAALFCIVDAAFFSSNLLKLADGGWVPLVLATIVFSVMQIWHRGVVAVSKVLAPTMIPLPEFFAQLERGEVLRPAGTAVFLTRSREGTPPLLAWHVRQNHSLYDRVVIVTLVTDLVPRIASAERFELKREDDKCWRVVVRSGFMEKLSLDDLLPALKAAGCEIDFTKVVYYVGHETIVRADKRPHALSMFSERLFAAMERNQAHLSDVLRLPPDQVVEVGRRVAL